MFGLDAAVQPWKPIPWSSLHTVLELNWTPHEVWRSVAIDSAESWRPLRTMRLSIRWPCSIILVAVISNSFHFVTKPLTVDCGIFRSEETSQLDLLHRWHPITVPCWNSLSSWEQPILSQMCVETVCVPRYLLSNTCGHGSDCNTWWVNTFGNIVYLWHELWSNMCQVIQNMQRKIAFINSSVRRNPCGRLSSLIQHFWHWCLSSWRTKNAVNEANGFSKSTIFSCLHHD